MSRHTQFHVFTPQRDEPEKLEKIFVKRQDLLEKIVEKLRDSVLTANKHHILLVGPRGMGKSYLVTLTHHRLSQQEDLRDSIRFAWLNEDETSTTFLHLLARIYRKLGETYPDEFPAAELTAIRGKEQATARELLGMALVKHLGKRTVVLLVENIDAIFRSLSEEEQLTWRAFIQDHPVIAILATAQGLTDELSSQKKPFYGFFDTRPLTALTVEEATELLEKIAELNEDQPLAEFLRTPHGKARLRAIHHLAGGNPRLYFILSDFLTKESLDNLVRLFEETVDRQLTPYYQERMRWLSPQQREIVQHLCRLVNPESVKDIAEAIFSSPNTISSQLKQLRGNGYLISKQRGKESLYELAEPLMRLSFQVKETNDRQPLTLIVDFLRVWYDKRDLQKRLDGMLQSEICWGYFHAALQKIDSEGDGFRNSIIRSSLGDIDIGKCDPSSMQDLRYLADTENMAEDWLKYGMVSVTVNEEQAAEAFARVHAGVGKTPEDVAISWASISYLNLGGGLREEDLVPISDFISNADPDSKVLSLVFIARGIYYNNHSDLDSALSDFLAALRDERLPSMLEGISYSYLAKIFFECKDYDQAFMFATEALALVDLPESEKIRTLFVKADIESVLERYEDAIMSYELLMSEANLNSTQLTIILVSRGLVYARLRKYKEAADDFLEIISSAPSDKGTMRFAYAIAIRSLFDGGMFSESLSLFAEFTDRNRENQLDPVDDLIAGLIETLMSSANEVYFSSGLFPQQFSAILSGLERWRKLNSFAGLFVSNLKYLLGLNANLLMINQWAADWERICAGFSEMEIPLRMHRVGIEWIKTRDEAVLLDLVKEERAIVRQALGLEPEKA